MLADATLAGIRHERDGQPLRIAATPWHGTLFYASVHGYGLGYTCNEWDGDDAALPFEG